MSKQSVKEVTRDDQKKINLFARKHRTLKEKTTEIEALKAKLQNINDGIDDLELHDDETDGMVPFMVGDIFIMKKAEDAVASLEESKSILEDKISKVGGEKDDVDGEIKKLKAELYGKFGNEINLEE